MEYDIGAMCRHAIDLSKGGLVEINTWNFGSDSLLVYITDRSSNLRCFSVAMCDTLTSERLVNAVMKLPFLEDLDISYNHEQLNLKAIGHSCPSLKTLKVNRMCVRNWDFGCNNDDALAIAETMPELRHLEFFGSGLLNTGLNAILDHCPHLEYLDLRRCFKSDVLKGSKI